MAKDATRFLALLRGINVGGNNVIKKEELAGCFEDLGFRNVRTYIASGNILFRSEETRVRELTAAIVSGLSERFSYDAKAVVLSHAKYAAAVAAAPEHWGSDSKWRHNALFTLPGITPRQVLAKVATPDPKLDRVSLAPSVLFWSSSKERDSETSIAQLAKTPAYRQVTVRNSNTVRKLLELFEAI